MKTVARALVGALALVMLASEPSRADETREGARLYRRYCAACHGIGGKGDGWVAPALGVPPADLTRLAARSGGHFPFLETITAIDGTKTVGPHGLSEMPVWGEVFASLPNFSPERRMEARRTIILITEHLRTLQR